MNRQIVCRECGERIIGKSLHREDVAMGWKRRVSYIDATIPADRGLPDGTADLRCDYCNKVVTREVCIAITEWNPAKPEPEPEDWERLYGNIIPDESVKVSDKLAS